MLWRKRIPAYSVTLDRSTAEARKISAEAYDWCCKNIDIGSWRLRIAGDTRTETYAFKDEVDATTFKLMWI